MIPTTIADQYLQLQQINTYSSFIEALESYHLSSNDNQTIFFKIPRNLSTYCSNMKKSFSEEKENLHPVEASKLITKDL